MSTKENKDNPELRRLARRAEGRGSIRGQRLIDLRLEHDISQAALSRASGISRATIQRIEENQTNPTASTIKALARAFGMTMSEFAGENPLPYRTLTAHPELDRKFRALLSKLSDDDPLLRILESMIDRELKRPGK